MRGCCDAVNGDSVPRAAMCVRAGEGRFLCAAGAVRMDGNLSGFTDARSLHYHGIQSDSGEPEWISRGMCRPGGRGCCFSGRAREEGEMRTWWTETLNSVTLTRGGVPPTRRQRRSSRRRQISVLYRAN